MDPLSGVNGATADLSSHAKLLTHHDPDRFQRGPTTAAGKVLRNGTHIIVPCLDSTVMLFLRLIPADLGVREIVFPMLVEEVDDPRVQRRLISLVCPSVGRTGSSGGLG